MTSHELDSHQGKQEEYITSTKEEDNPPTYSPRSAEVVVPNGDDVTVANAVQNEPRLPPHWGWILLIFFFCFPGFPCVFAAFYNYWKTKKLIRSGNYPEAQEYSDNVKTWMKMALACGVVTFLGSMLIAGAGLGAIYGIIFAIVSSIRRDCSNVRF